MKFTPKHLEENVNVSKTSVLTELSWLLGGVVLLLVLAFFILGAMADLIVERVPVNVESWLGGQTLKKFSGKESPEMTSRLEGLLASLPKDSPLQQYAFHVYVLDTDEVNAVALPGGNIVVYQGLLDEVESENELAMVLGHELGHFANRDHLRGLGRGLGVAVVTGIMFGGDSSASTLVSNSLLTVQAQYSQHQEEAADRFGLDLLTKRYGHAGGAATFFSRLAGHAGGRLPYLLASHPHPQDRIDKLNQRIRTSGYAVHEVQPLALEMKSEQD